MHVYEEWIVHFGPGEVSVLKVSVLYVHVHVLSVNTLSVRGY